MNMYICPAVMQRVPRALGKQALHWDVIGLEISWTSDFSLASCCQYQPKGIKPRAAGGNWLSTPSGEKTRKTQIKNEVRRFLCGNRIRNSGGFGEGMEKWFYNWIWSTLIHSHGHPLQINHLIIWAYMHIQPPTQKRPHVNPDANRKFSFTHFTY